MPKKEKLFSHFILNFLRGSCLKGIVTLVTCYNNFKFKTKLGHRRRRMRPSRTHFFLDSHITHNFTQLFNCNVENMPFYCVTFFYSSKK